MNNDLNNITKTEKEEQTTQAPAQELSESDLGEAVGGLLTTTLSNIANLQHDTQKNIANNIRA